MKFILGKSNYIRFFHLLLFNPSPFSSPEESLFNPSRHTTTSRPSVSHKIYNIKQVASSITTVIQENFKGKACMWINMCLKFRASNQDVVALLLLEVEKSLVLMHCQYFNNVVCAASRMCQILFSTGLVST